MLGTRRMIGNMGSPSLGGTLARCFGKGRGEGMFRLGKGASAICELWKKRRVSEVSCSDVTRGGRFCGEDEKGIFMCPCGVAA